MTVAAIRKKTHTQTESLYLCPSSSMLLTLKSTPMVAVVSSSDKKSSSVKRSSNDDLPEKENKRSAIDVSWMLSLAGRYRTSGGGKRVQFVYM